MYGHTATAADTPFVPMIRLETKKKGRAPKSPASWFSALGYSSSIWLYMRLSWIS